MIADSIIRQKDKKIKKASRVSLWALLNIPFAMILLVSAALIGFLGIQSGTQAANDLATQQQTLSAARVNQYLDSYLATPQLINGLNLDALRLGQVDFSDPVFVEHHIMAQLQHFPTVASIAFANEQGEYIGISRQTLGVDYLLSIYSQEIGYVSGNYETDLQGNHGQLLSSIPNYDPTSRIWYQSAVQAGQSTWTPIFVWSQEMGVGLDQVTPIYTERGQLLGVLDVSLVLEGINSFLQSAPVTEHGSIFIVDEAGLLVASSTSQNTFSVTNNSVDRLNAQDVDEPVIKAAAQRVTAQSGGWAAVENNQQLHFDSLGERYLMSVTPYQNNGLRWWMVVVTPESDFLAGINNRFRLTELLIVLAMVLSIVVTTQLARRISRPILQLNQASKELAAGNWSARVPVSRQNELGELALSFNHMAEQLQNSTLSLQSSEARLRAIFENSVDAIAVSDKDGFVTYNPAFQAMFGYKPTEVGRQVLDAIAPSERERIGDYVRRRSQGQSAPQMYETRGLRRDGSEFDMEVRVTTFIQDSELYTLGLLRDITKRKRAEDSLRDNLALLENAQGLARMGSYTIDLITRTLSLSAATARLYAASDEPLTMPLEVFRENFLHPDDRRRVTGAADTSYETGKLIQQENRLVRGDGQIIWIQSRSIVMPNGMQVLGMVQDITERKLAEEKLKLSETQLKDAQQIARIGSSYWDVKTNLTTWSDETYRIYGWDPALPVPTREERAKLYVPESFALINNSVSRALDTGEPYEIELELVRVDGVHRQVQARGAVVRDDEGTITALQGTLQDITEQKMADIALRSSEENYRSMAENSASAIAILDRNGLILYANRTGIRIWRDPQIVGRTIFDIFPDESVRRYEAAIRHVIDTQITIQDEVESPINGQLMWFRISMSPLKNPDGSVNTLLLNAWDITERKQAEEELRSQTRRLDLATHSAQIGIWDWDIQKNELIWDGRMYALYGIQSRDFGSAYEAWLNGLHPDDRERGDELTNKALRGEQEFDTEFRVLWPDGSVHWLKANGQVFWNEDHQPLRMVGVNYDITERKQAEVELQASAKIAHQMTEQLRMVNQIGAKITAGLDLDRLLQALYEECQRIGETDHFYVSLYDDLTDMLSFPLNYENGNRSPIPSRRNHTVSGLTEYILEHRQTLHIPNTFDLPSTNPFIRKPDDPTRSYIGVPLMIKDLVIGVLSMQSNKPNAYSLEQIRTLELLATPAAIAIQNSQLHEQAQQEIAERRQTEEKLRTSEAQLKDAQRIGHMGSWYRDVNTGTIIWSDELYQLVGRDPALQVPSRDELMKIYTPESFALRENASARTVETGEPYDLELELVKPDGVRRDVRARGDPVRDNKGTVIALQGTVEDITERKQAERNLQKQLTELEALYENGLIISQLLSQKEIGQKTIELLEKKMNWHHIVIRLLNPKNEKLELLAFTGYGANGETDPREIESYLNISISALEDGLTGWAIKNSETLNLNNLNQDPRYKRLFPGMQSGMYVPMIANQQKVGVISIESENLNAFSDSDERLVTTLANQAAVALENARLFQIAEAELVERKRIEKLLEEERNQLAQRVEDRTSDLSRSNADLGRALRVKDEFLASMSHELRTPLTGILGLSEVMQLKTYGELSEKQSKTLKNIEESGRHLLDLINDILDLSKIEAGMLELRFEPCSLEDICQASLQLTKGMAQHKKQQIRYSPPAEPVMIRADARHLKQILVNLLSNAIKFSPEKGELGLDVYLNKAGQNIKLTVWDKGIGIKPENMHKLFKPFTQIDGSLAREYSGTGLGLSLVQRLAELHHGGIEVESVFGEGSRFTLTLPWSSPDEIALHPLQHKLINENSTTDTPLKNFVPPSILIADDNEGMLELFADYLEFKQYRVIKTRSGAELLERSTEIHPAVILVDIQMPGMDGLETIRRIRSHKDPLVATVPVIAVTALAMIGDRENCLEAGANEYLSKPVSLAELIAVIQKLIGKK